MKSRLSIIICLIIPAVVFCAGCEPKSTSKMVDKPTESDRPAVEPKAKAVETKVEPTTEKGPETALPTPPESVEVQAGEPSAPAEKFDENVAAIVNGVTITEDQVEERIKPQLDRMAERMSPKFIDQYKDQLKQQAVEGLIIEQLMEKEIEKANITVTEQEVADFIENLASEQNLTIDQLKDMVTARGQNFEQLKEDIRKGLPFQKLLTARFADEINVTEADAQKFYSENPQQFEKPEEVRASHILIKTDTSDPNADPNDIKVKAKAKVEQLLQQIRDGADFATLARANSDCPSAQKGGDLGFFGRGRMVPLFEKAAFALKVGQVSDVVETRFGYHIIRVTDRREPETITFEQAKDDIINRMTRLKQTELSRQYIESLKAEAKIVYPPGKEPKMRMPTARPAVPPSPR